MLGISWGTRDPCSSLQHVGSSSPTRLPALGPRSLSHCSNREVPELVIDPFPPKNKYCFPDCLLFCVLKTWLGFLPTGACKCQFLLLQTAKCQIVSAVSMTVQKCDCAQFVASILPTALWKDSLSLFSFGYCIVRPLKMTVLLLSIHILFNQRLLHLYLTHKTDHPRYLPQTSINDCSY